MFLLMVSAEFSAAHSLPAEMSEKCSHTHGHNYAVTAELIRARALGVDAPADERYFVMDMGTLKGLLKSILDEFDHQNLNDALYPSTAENIAEFIGDALNAALADADAPVRTYSVTVQETPSCAVRYYPALSYGETFGAG